MRVFLVFALCLAWGAAKAQCPVGVGTTACEPFSTFTNSVPLASSPSSTDRTPYVQGSATHYVPPTAIDFRLYGAAPNSATDSSAAIQAAFTANPGGTFTCAGNYYTIASTVNVTTKVHLTDCGYPSSFGGSNDSPVGFYAGTSNLTMFDIHSTGNHFENTYINMMFNNVVNTSGTAIIQEGHGAGNGNGYGTFNHLQIDYACNVISINGIVDTVSDINAEQQGGGAQCFGVEVGNLTTGGATNGAALHNIFVQTNSSNLPASNFAFFDGGGSRVDGISGLGGSLCGTCFIPGNNQVAPFIRVDNSDFGDALGTGPSVLINPGASTGVVRGLTLVNDWASSSQQHCGMVISNTNGGTVDTVSVTNLQAYGNHPCGIDIEGAPSSSPPANVAPRNIKIANSFLCGNKDANNPDLGEGILVNLASAVPPANVSLLGNTMSATCGGQTSVSQPISLYIAGGSANELLIQNNDLTNFFIAPVQFDQIVTGSAIISNNLGLDNSFPTKTPVSGAVVNLGLLPEFALTSGSTLTTLDPGWDWRVLKILSQGVSTITTGGNFCSSVGTITTAEDRVYQFQYDPSTSCWGLI